MRIVVLGGAGDMGSEAVRDLVKFTDAEQVTVADLNTVAAERLAADLGDKRVVVKKVDATSRDELVEVLKGHDVAAGALGPFYRFERPIVEAAIEAGVNYVSICDDHDAAEAVLGLDEAAKEKGLKILTGLGWTPGLTNIFARKGYGELDEVEKINVYWAGSAGDSEGLAVILHTIHIFTGHVASYQNGEFMLVKAGSGKEWVDFPAPLGKVATFHLGHPEPVTLPRYLKGVKEVTLKGGLVENYLNNLAKMMAAMGFTSTPARKQRLGRLMKRLLPLFPSNKERSLSGARVDLTGTLEGKRVRITYATVDHMKRLTGIPLGIGAWMMAQGKIKRLGVYGPEADDAVDPDEFLAELARREVKVERTESVL
ncbi:MAG: saccharopine dehydrogenase [Firmicutes bacterium]|jgi:saccharopine dehydrogenase-like NADP-dependent oxidoreductase|nr:saccharopine dehydrogenase [Bacillota bacterium]HPU00720.1 saccharopine dehydrogenase NADP-binding domain-containing protein [Bacillota bacterium]